MMNHIIVAMKQRSGRFGGSNRHLNDDNDVDHHQEVTAGDGSNSRWISQATPAFPRPMNGLSPKRPIRQESIPRKVADHHYKASLTQQEIDDMLSTTEVEETEHGSSQQWTDNDNDLRVWKLDYPEDDRTITNTNQQEEEEEDLEEVMIVQQMEVITTDTTATPAAVATDASPARRRLRRKKRLFDRTPYPKKMTFRFRGGGTRNNNTNNSTDNQTGKKTDDSATPPRLPNRRLSAGLPKPGMILKQELLEEELEEEDAVVTGSLQSSSPAAPSPKRRGRQHPPRLPRRKLSRDH